MFSFFSGNFWWPQLYYLYQLKITNPSIDYLYYGSKICLSSKYIFKNHSFSIYVLRILIIVLNIYRPLIIIIENDVKCIGVYLKEYDFYYSKSIMTLIK